MHFLLPVSYPVQALVTLGGPTKYWLSAVCGPLRCRSARFREETWNTNVWKCSFFKIRLEICSNRLIGCYLTSCVTLWFNFLYGFVRLKVYNRTGRAKVLFKKVKSLRGRQCEDQEAGWIWISVWASKVLMKYLTLIDRCKTTLLIWHRHFFD